MSFSSTVPGAITAVQGYFQAVADQLPGYNLGTFIGPPLGAEAPLNFLMLGAWPDGSQGVTGYQQSWANWPASAGWRDEPYTLQCVVRAAAGDPDPAARYTDAFTILDALVAQFLADPTGGGALGPPGSWGDMRAEVVYVGLTETGAMSVVLGLAVSTLNIRVRLT